MAVSQIVWAAYNGYYASHSWHHKATYDVTAALWCNMVRGHIGDVLAIIENNQFINLIEWLFQLKYSW